MKLHSFLAFLKHDLNPGNSLQTFNGPFLDIDTFPEAAKQPKDAAQRSKIILSCILAIQSLNLLLLIVKSNCVNVKERTVEGLQ
jgi:hypothetical protein